MREQIRLHVGAHLRFYRRSRIVLAVGLVILAFWALGVVPMLLDGTAGDRFNKLKSLAEQITGLGWILSAGLGLYLTSSHLRNKSLQVILTRPGSPQVWLASVFVSALLVAAAIQAAGAVVTFAFSVAWDVPYQVGFLYLAIDAIFEAAIAIAFLTTLGAVVHPVVALLLAALFNEGTFGAIRFGLTMMATRAPEAGAIGAAKTAVVWIHEALPMLDPFSTRTAGVSSSLRVSTSDWGYLGATALYALAVIAICFLLSDLALRRRSFASTT